MDLGTLINQLNVYEPAFSADLQKIAEDQLTETRERREQACQDLYKEICMSETPEFVKLHNSRLTSPRFLLRFLRVSKFKIDRAKGKLIAWLKTIDGTEWPELADRLKEEKLLIDFVYANKLFLLQNTAKPEFGSYASWVNINQSARDQEEEISNYYLNIAAVSIIMVDHMMDVDEACHVTGLITARIQGDEGSSSNIMNFISNFSLFRKMISVDKNVGSP